MEAQASGHDTEDLGPTVAVLRIVVSTIYEPLKKQWDSSMPNEKFMENCQEIVISVFEFWSTFTEGSVKAFKKVWASKMPLKNF